SGKIAHIIRAIFNVKQAAHMTILSSASFQTRLGINHGYRFEGDFVNLNAEVSFSDDDLAGGQAWSLQLWSSDQGFAAGLNGVKVAELAIVPMAGGIAVDGLSHAMPPAGAGDKTVALALVAFAADGQPQLRDLAVYPAAETFVQPLLSGNVTCARPMAWRPWPSTASRTRALPTT